ncbi:FHA domain-containing protein [Nostoc sp. 'Lobaria pulmonaria (5183) cyanobiont']|uniref:FHA domain-containing protein n=1 Tax=Nostoc sp. 'Lobaria pulmonaria (5183) cyanobiont' TaxID=1618022 RepID=UPI000CF323E8|nr:FHA domain-containing protein [Nostoc sp. 'Lobaria pulmonaria (5183) cyanobiont']AVH72700.1 methylglyoxal synthase [Nostoc sp. 'Lobaria pulmonaria (5183) cyanobiont']
MKVKVSYSPNLSEVNEVDITLETTPRGEWVIGRSPDSDLVLDSPDISRVHAKFFIKSGNYYFSDLGSRNGSIFNGKQTEKDRSYSLSDGDIIRIADYVLILSAVAPAYEQPETVFRIIDPSLFSRSRSPENVSAANVVNPAPEAVNKVPAPISQEVETPEIKAASPEISEISEVVSNQPDDVIPVVEIIAPENIIQPPEAVNDVPHDVRNEIGDLPTFSKPDGEEVGVPEVSEASEVSLTEPNDAIAARENIIETPEEESVLPEANHDEAVGFEAALATESTFVQQRDISAIPETTDDENAELEAALEAEVTFVQPRDIFNEVPAQSPIPEATDDENTELEAALAAEVTSVQPRDIFHHVSEEESDIPEATHDEVVNLDTPVAEKASEVVENKEIQPQEALSQATQDTTDEAIDWDTSVTAADSADVDKVEPTSAVDETISKVSEASTAPDDAVAEVLSNQYIDLSNASTEEVSLYVDGVAAQISEISDLTDIPSLETTESGTTENISQTIEELPEVEEDRYDETPEETNVSESPQAIIERNIVLLAHESKKSELAELVSEHQEFFSQSFTITWPSVSEVLHQQAGITISQQTAAPTSGGYQTIASLVGAGEIVAVIFLRDLLQPQPGQANEEALLRLCTINQVLLATNLPTAEAIVHYLKHI